MPNRKSLIRGDDYTFVLKIVDNDVPRDLTGIQQVCYQVFDSMEENTLLYEATIDNGVNIPDLSSGVIYIHLPYHVSENIKTFQLYHKCKIVDQSSRRTTVLSDCINFYKNNII